MAKKKKRQKKGQTPQVDDFAPSAPKAASEKGDLQHPTPFWQDEWQCARQAVGEALKDKQWFLFFVVAAFVTRFFQLTEASLWMDEIVILKEAGAGVYETVSWRGHKAHLAPVSFFLNLFGENAFGLRFWGAFLGALAIPVTYLWVHTAFDQLTARVVSLLVLFSPFLLMYAQDGNYYGGMTFYTAVSLLLYVLYFRGNVYSSPLLLGAVSVINFWNHPISILLSGVLFGGMGFGLLVFPKLRSHLIALKPADWKYRPGVPVLAIMMVIAIPFVGSVYQRFTGFAGSLISPGETTLTNVQFSFGFFRSHFTAMTVSFFRMGEVEKWFSIISLVYTIAGFLLMARQWTTNKNRSSLALAGLAVVAPLASYGFLFSVQVDRNFNLRYFIFLVPILLMMIGVAVAWGWKILEGRVGKNSSAQFLAALPVAFSALFAMKYFATDTGNYGDGIERLAENNAREQLILPVRNDRVQGEYYLEKEGFAINGPGYTWLNQPGYPDMYGGALPYLLPGRSAYFLSAWRFVEAPKMWAILDALPREYRGTSRLGNGHDLLISRYDDRVSFLYPRAASRVGEDVVVAGAGTWRSGAGQDVTFDRVGRHSLQDGLYRPVLKDVEFYGVEDIISAPSHTKIFLNEELSETVGLPVLRNERDDSYDFLVYEPKGGSRKIVLKALPRPEKDPLLEKNPQPLEGPLHLAIAIDGQHLGTWKVDGVADQIQEIPIDLDLKKGNHRISISGFLPRLGYTAYFPWNFAGFEWTSNDVSEGSPALEVEGESPFASGWSRPVSPGEPGEKPNANYSSRGPFSMVVDGDVPLPSGLPSIRVTFPGGVESSSLYLGPPMEIHSGEKVLYSYYYRLEALREHEITQAIAFFDAEGNSLGFTPTNGPNRRGTTLGTGWKRAVVTAEVPDGTVILRPAFQTFPYEGTSSEGRFWFGDFKGPETESKQTDPLLLQDVDFSLPADSE